MGDSFLDWGMEADNSKRYNCNASCMPFIIRWGIGLEMLDMTGFMSLF